ncbi:26S proteasome subunit RPN7-domain-containing protein [Dimargaris cristalligena]|uniref:26S proteasome subunit RPN7-domain-containing protein n=1 Tax=Dimargaris cristalligena TaxID=215637 RepID=A0A4P9ZNJ8_9FUNG|nr:26S proteasome subunit RPN7-domain-containing protein [Dimargaris cristalligena]|eukprot:RKP34181.1 26S proteasome subunit RPN7-domain-containing protein [Dimargaris cristalligena]
MAPWYPSLCEELAISPDQVELERMTKANQATLAGFETERADAEENLGETETSELLLKKAQYLAEIGDKVSAVLAYRVAFDKAATIGQRLDITFAFIRIGLFFLDNDLISRNIKKARSLIEEGGDWDRRNRLKSYEAIYLMSIRDFKGASQLFLDSLSTFTSTELMDYNEYVKYAVVVGMISLPRVDLKKKLIDAPEVLEVLVQAPQLEEYLKSLYDCRYAKFFQSLAAMEKNQLLTSRYLHVHTPYYVREMRIIAYAQLLESYRSLTLESMADSFGVSEDFVDRDLARFIAAGRLNCVIDKVNGIVVTNRPDVKNAQYQACIKQGDILLNRVQKLSRVINL